jgi:hypothetical protein
LRWGQAGVAGTRDIRAGRALVHKFTS